MKKLFTICVICLTFFVNAETLNYGKSFFNPLFPQIGFSIIECPDEILGRRSLFWLCAKANDPSLLKLKINQQMVEAKKRWTKFAPIIAKKISFQYKVIKDWEYIDLAEDYFLDFSLNGKPLTAILRQSDGVLYLLALADTDETSANITSNNISTSSSSSYVLEVLRYRCEPSQNGYARVYGTVKNTSLTTFEYLQFTVEFFNGSDFVGQESGYVKADKLEPDRETTFDRLVKVSPYSRCAISFEGKDGKLAVQLP
jgi:hypothetical protein